MTIAGPSNLDLQPPSSWSAPPLRHGQELRLGKALRPHEHVLAVLDLLDQTLPDAQHTTSSRGTAAVVKD